MFKGSPWPMNDRDRDESDFLEDGKLPADGTLFGWDKRFVY